MKCDGGTGKGQLVALERISHVSRGTSSLSENLVRGGRKVQPEETTCAKALKFRGGALFREQEKLSISRT